MSDLRAAIEAACQKSEALTQDAMGHVSQHWRGQDYADGLDAGIETTTALVREALAAHPEMPPVCWCSVCIGTCSHPEPVTAQPDATLRTLLRAETARADAAEADARHWRTTALWYGAPDKAARP